MPSAPILTVAGAKGGVGKTTTVLTVGSLFTSEGLRVVVVDADPQASATAWLHQDTVPDALSPTELTPIRVHTDPSGGELLLAPGGRAMERVGVDEMQAFLRRLSADADLVIVDTVPALQPSVYAALLLSACLLVPLQAEYLAARGLAEMLAVRDAVGSSARPKALLTRYRGNLRLAQSVEGQIEEVYPQLLCRARVPVDVRCAEAPGAGLPLPQFAPRSRAARAYREVQRELMPLLQLVPKHGADHA